MQVCGHGPTEVTMPGTAGKSNALTRLPTVWKGTVYLESPWVWGAWRSSSGRSHGLGPAQGKAGRNGRPLLNRLSLGPVPLGHRSARGLQGPAETREAACGWGSGTSGPDSPTAGELPPAAPSKLFCSRAGWDGPGLFRAHRGASGGGCVPSGRFSCAWCSGGAVRPAEGDRMRGPKNRSRATSGSSSRGDAVALRTGRHCSVTPKAGRGRRLRAQGWASERARAALGSVVQCGCGHPMDPEGVRLSEINQTDSLMSQP